MASRNVFFFRTTGSYAASYNQGPWRVSTLGKLLRLHLTGSIYSGLTGITVSTFVLDNPICWGVQFGPHGYTPVDLVLGGNAANWLRTGALEIGNFATYLDAAVTTMNYGASYDIDFEMRSQIPINIDTDFYLSIKNPWGSGSTSAVGGMLEVMSS
jgi:hypothetical protein